MSEGIQGWAAIPGVLPVMSVGTNRLEFNITYIPKVEPKIVSLWLFQLKIGFSGWSRLRHLLSASHTIEGELRGSGSAHNY